MSSIAPEPERERKQQERLEAEASKTSPLSPAAAPSRKLRVFLCHAFQDKATVRRIYDLLIRDGVDAWFDEESLIAGQAWDTEIQNAVRASDVVVVCLSRLSITKEGYVQKEIRYALNVADEKPEGTIFLIPAKLEECEVPQRLKDKHSVDLSQDTGYAKLLKALIERAKTARVIAPASFEPRPVPELLRAAARGKAVLVLGRYPEYLRYYPEQATRRDVRTFSFNADVWNRMTAEEPWEANRRFIDEAIKRDDEIVLATKLEKVPLGSTLEKEIMYLLSHGYETETRLVRREEP